MTPSSWPGRWCVASYASSGRGQSHEQTNRAVGAHHRDVLFVRRAGDVLVRRHRRADEVVVSTIVFRLDRGPFQGVVSRHDAGPWSGWYAVSWSAGEEVGGRQA